MEYAFVRTVYGPMVVGDGEVLAFHQFPQLHDYAVEHPSFIEEAKEFLEITIKEFSEAATQSLYGEILGEEYYTSVDKYIFAIKNLKMFERQFAEAKYLPEFNPNNT